MKECSVPSVDEYKSDLVCEQWMKDGFAAVAAAVLADAHRYKKNTDTFFAGLEIELPLVTSTFNLAPQHDRDALIRQFTKHTSPELAAHQLEIISEPPVDLLQQGLGALEHQMAITMTSILREASNRGLYAVRLGCYPLVDIDDVDYTRGDPCYRKYERSPRWHMANRRQDTPADLGWKEVVRIDNAYVVGLMNATQVTIDAQNFPDAVDKLNRSLMISPYAVAIGANARYLSCSDTGMCDIRFAAWEISHDVRSPDEVALDRPTRIGLPQCYYRDMDDYFKRIQSYPFILDDPISMTRPFEVGLGLYWRDARLKFFQEKKTVAVEFRPVALQPSLHEDIAMMLFYVGRLIWSQRTKESLLPMDIVRENKCQAVTHGLHGQLWYQQGTTIECASARLVMEKELNRAVEGLRLLGAPTNAIVDVLQVLWQRLDRGSPAEQFVAVVEGIEATISQTQKDRRRMAIIKAIEQLGLVIP